MDKKKEFRERIKAEVEEHDNARAEVDRKDAKARHDRTLRLNKDFFKNIENAYEDEPSEHYTDQIRD